MKPVNLIQKAILLIWLTIVCTALTSAAPPVKIAIIGAPGKYKAEIDLLTEKLSAKKSLHILDRVDIDYLIKEHAIAASEISKNSIKIGELIGADGVIVLSDVKVKGKKYAYLRLVGVKNGIILGTYAYPLDEKSESLDWLGGIHKQFALLFSKLKLTKKEALPVSLLNFRSSSPSQSIIKLETIIPKLLTIGLNHDPKIVVTERWNAWQVAFEKELANDLSNFNTGNVLIDGSIEEKGDDIEIMARINKPGTDKKHEIKISGSKKELPTLMRELSASLCKYLTKTSTTVKWDTAAEAKKFYEEAKWAYEFSKYQQAEEAADAAMALGMDDFELAILRVRILGGKYFVIHDKDYQKHSWESHFQPVGDPIEHPEKYLFKVCKALDSISDIRRKLLAAKQNGKWKTKNNFEEFDRIERNFLVFSSRLLIQSHIAKLQKSYRFSDHVKMLQLKTIKLFDSIIKRPPWKKTSKLMGSRVDDHIDQAYMIFFGTSVCWFQNFDKWLAKFNEILSVNPSCRQLDAVWRGWAWSRYRFYHCGKKWPFQIKGLDEIMEIPPKQAFRHFETYITSLKSSRIPKLSFTGCVLFDFSPKDNPKRGGEIFQYLKKHIKTAKKGTIEYERCRIAAKLLVGDGYDFPYIFDLFNGPRVSVPPSFCVDLVSEMEKPPWDIINRLQKSFSNKDRKIIINTIENYIQKHPNQNLKEVNIILKDIRRKYNRLNKPKEKYTRLNQDPFSITPFLKFSDLPHLKKKRIYEIHLFSQNEQKLLITGKTGKIVRIKKGNSSKATSTLISESFILLVDKNTQKYEFLAIPNEVDGKSIYPKREKIDIRGFSPNMENTFLGTKKENALICVIPPRKKYRDNHYQAIKVEKGGDIIAYNSQTQKWRWLDSLELGKMARAVSYKDILYIAFGENEISATNSSALKIPTGIIQYDVNKKTKNIILNNQILSPKSKIESEKKFIIKKLVPASENILYFITQHKTEPKVRLHKYDYTLNKITTVKNLDYWQTISNEGSNLLLYDTYLLNVSDDFDDFRPLLNNRKFFYQKSKNENQQQWCRNLYHSQLWAAFKLEHGMLSVHKTRDDPNRHVASFNLLKEYFAFEFWQDGNSKSKIIPVTTEAKTAGEKLVQVSALIDGDNIWLLGNSDQGINQEGVWRVSLTSIRDFLKKKLDYPYIFPFGWKSNPTKKKVTFWPKQKITMEDLGEGVEVRYTTDGSWPDENSKLYTKPFVIDKSMNIIARAFKKGMYPSDPFIVSYTKKKKNNP